MFKKKNMFDFSSILTSRRSTAAYLGSYFTMENNGSFALCILFLELALCWAYAMFVDYTGESIGIVVENDFDRVRGTHVRKHLSSIYYYMFQDVHLTVVIGFGFLATFLKRYGNSSVVSTLLVVAITLQWATLCQGFFQMQRGKIHVSITNLVHADFATLAILISFGAVLDLTTPTQLIIMAICEILCFATNEYICLDILQISDVGVSMLVHVFAAYFGLTVSCVLRKNRPERETVSITLPTSDLFAVIGTMFLWLFWPTLNASLAQGDAQHRAVINTYYSLAASTVVTLAISLSSLLDNKRSYTVQIQNSALAGGVAIGTAADMMIYPFGAIIVGCFAGLVSVLGVVVFTPGINRIFGIRDTNGVHNLHGLPGLISAFVGAIAAAFATEKNYNYTLYRLFPARTPMVKTPDYWNLEHHVGNVVPGLARSALSQGAYQIAALGTTLAFAIFGGLITGFVLRLPLFNQRRRNNFINDEV
ncbi:ammonium transporter Rh type B-like isoform X2 [Daphnia pulicaria]|uniref:ammonium transporter Rh type B-like isoform X2 n=1 Tax=Daphnia pulicaria TaxID=35523 RepID=UPI001EEA5543|nr:ammonium transporter Rh type B-like isoform X2 [Daphnia pulicaria]